MADSFKSDHEAVKRQRKSRAKDPTAFLPKVPWVWRGRGRGLGTGLLNVKADLHLRMISSKVQRHHAQIPPARSGILQRNEFSRVGSDKVFGLFQVSELCLHVQDSAQ